MSTGPKERAWHWAGISALSSTHCTISHQLPQFPYLWHRDVNSAKRCTCCIQQVVSKCWSSFPLHPSGVGRAPQGLWVKGSSAETWEDRVLHQSRPLRSRSLLIPGAGPGDCQPVPGRTRDPRLCSRSPCPQLLPGGRLHAPAT